MNKPYVCIIGGANADITCETYAAIKTKDSNPGRVTVACGGVARNVAENLARLGVNVVLITVLGTDAHADMIRRNAEEVGIDASHSLVREGESSCYVSVNDVDKDMFVGVAAMDVLAELTPEYLATKEDVINGAACVVTDTNIPQCLEYITTHAAPPVFLDPVSAKKTVIADGLLRNLYCIKPNRYEAEILSGVEIKDEESAYLAAKKISERNIKVVYISCGEDGVYCYKDGEFRHVKGLPADIVNTTGAGDSFMAGAVYGYLNGRDYAESATIGSVCSAITIADRSTVSKNVSAEAVEKIMKNITTGE